MDTKKGPSRLPIAIGGVAVVVVCLVGAWVWSKARSHQAALKEAANEPHKLVLAAEQGKITEAERDNALKQSIQSHLSEQVDGYFALPEGKARNDYLDKLIDAQEQAKARIQAVKDATAAQPDWEKQPEGVTTKVTRSADGTSENRQVFIKQKGDASTLPPELRAKVAEFAAAMAKRRAERGLPAGPGGGMGVVIVKTKEEPR